MAERMVSKGAVRTVLFGEKQKQRRTISCFAETVRTLFVTLFKQKTWVSTSTRPLLRPWESPIWKTNRGIPTPYVWMYALQVCWGYKIGSYIHRALSGIHSLHTRKHHLWHSSLFKSWNLSCFNEPVTKQRWRSSYIYVCSLGFHTRKPLAGWAILHQLAAPSQTLLAQRRATGVG